VTESGKQPPQSEQQPPHDTSFKCPHCGHAQIVQIRASEVVTVCKCPACGELVAPAKKH
jgi:transcription elongation factor Elf1